jgi:hypothetical protein
VLDYRIWYDNSSGGTFEIYTTEAGLTHTVTGLTQG